VDEFEQTALLENYVIPSLSEAKTEGPYDSQPAFSAINRNITPDDVLNR